MMTPEQLGEIKKAAESDDTIPNKTARDILALLVEVERLQARAERFAEIVTDYKQIFYGAETVPCSYVQDILDQIAEDIGKPEPPNKPQTLTEKHDSELIIFVVYLKDNGFSLPDVVPYLTITWEETEGNRLQLRFEVKYPKLIPVCKYVAFENGNIKTNNEWFVPGDIVFYQGSDLENFKAAMKYAGKVAGLPDVIEAR